MSERWTWDFLDAAGASVEGEPTTATEFPTQGESVDGASGTGRRPDVTPAEQLRGRFRRGGRRSARAPPP